MHVQLLCWTRGLKLSLDLIRRHYFVCARSKRSDETARMLQLVKNISSFQMIIEETWYCYIYWTAK